MTRVSPARAGAGAVVFYRVKRVKGRYYLVKEWWDPGLKKKITKSIGPCEWLEGLSEEYRERTRGTRGPAPRVVPRPGFEPGSRARKARSRRGAQPTVSPGNGSTVEPYYRRLWETWCLERGTSPETCARYSGYLQKPLDPGNRWSAKAWKLYYKWRCELGDQTACEDYKRVKVPQAGADKRVPSLEAILDSIERAGPYRIVYIILLESGLRLVEAVKLIREYDRLECTRLDGYTRCLLGYTRGKKRALWGYHITPVEPMEDLTDRRVTSYAEKYRLTPPKYIRKFVATKMAELGVPFEVIDFIQGRTPRSVLLQHYAQLLGVADREYAKYARWLRGWMG
ncbi:integrase [Aeropyrum globular virus 1]|uniref:integrase n=1 Tax=Aeropyrum globular virus 1 TaxID=1932713 RepID=UPI000C7F1965|nr:integrase [Aeropyrum globular virus 1]BBC20951.1 integrase [Aeropyrum globular virus 1]